MKNKTYIVGLCILLLLVAGAAYKISPFIFFTQYEEECLAYGSNITYEKHCRCESDWIYAVWCNTECCDCPEDGKVFYNTYTTHYSDKCIKYHLVRNEG